MPQICPSTHKVQMTKRTAKTFLNDLHQSGNWKHKQKGRVYQCPYCNYWHITHVEDSSHKRFAVKVRLKFGHRFMWLLLKAKKKNEEDND